MAVQQVTGVEAAIEPDSTIASAVLGESTRPMEPIAMESEASPAATDVQGADLPSDTPAVTTSNHLDFEVAYDATTAVRNVPNFTTMFKATHKDVCTTSAFTPDGRYAATGSIDTSIKILDISKMKTMKEGDKPVLKTLYGHTSAVNDLAFHPNGKVLASVSSDCTVKLFDLTRASSKKAIHSLQDVHPIKSIAFHPSGDFFALGVEDTALRLYDIHTLQCFTNMTDPDNAHFLGISQVKIAPTTGSWIATAGDDGDVRIWDIVSGSCVHVIQGAHDRWPVTSVRISLNEKYLLTCGRDNTGRLWEWQTGRLIHTFEGATTRNVPAQMTFNYNEDHVYGCDEATQSIVCWDSRTGRLLKKFKGHEKAVRMVAASPVEDAFISCSEDHRARFWYPASLAQ